MSGGQFCVDANIFLAAWYVIYPVDVLPTLWKQLANCRNEIVLIQPIFDEIEPIFSHDRKLPPDKKKEKYPLRVWMQENRFEATPVTDELNAVSLGLEREYEISPLSKGAGQKDITLITYAKITGKTVVTFESEQPNKPGKKSNYRIPLICQEQDVECCNFVQMIRCLNVKI